MLLDSVNTLFGLGNKYINLTEPHYHGCMDDGWTH